MMTIGGRMIAGSPIVLFAPPGPNPREKGYPEITSKLFQETKARMATEADGGEGGGEDGGGEGRGGERAKY